MSSACIFIDGQRMMSCKFTRRENFSILLPAGRKTHCHGEAAGRAMQQETWMPGLPGSSVPSASVHFPADQLPKPFTRLIKKSKQFIPQTRKNCEDGRP